MPCYPAPLRAVRFGQFLAHLEDRARLAARDFLDVAAALARAKSLGTVAEADLKQLQTDYARHLREGEAKAMAEQWTALDLACRELYPALGKVAAESKLDDKRR